MTTETKSYTISFREGCNYRITLQFDAGLGIFRPPSFAKDVQILKIPGDT